MANKEESFDPRKKLEETFKDDSEEDFDDEFEMED